MSVHRLHYNTISPHIDCLECLCGEVERLRVGIQDVINTYPCDIFDPRWELGSAEVSADITRNRTIDIISHLLRDLLEGRNS